MYHLIPLVVLLVLVLGMKVLVTGISRSKGESAGGWAAAIATFVVFTLFIFMANLRADEVDRQSAKAIAAQADAVKSVEEARTAHAQVLSLLKELEDCRNSSQ